MYNLERNLQFFEIDPYIVMLMKHLIVLACILPAILSRTYNRQWQDGDNRENCTEVYSDECISCTEPELCNPETEIKCGETPQDNDIYELVVNCPPNDVCIPKGCECKLNQMN